VKSVKQQGTLFDLLGHVLAPGQIITNPIQLLTYESDASLDHRTPDGVAFPLTSGEVVRLVKWASEHQVPLVARGAGTGLSGGAVAEQGGIIVEFSRMNRVIELDEVGRSAVVQPGVVNLVLDEMAETKGLHFPPDPASGRVATLGGNIAENAGGPHCFKYGVTTNYVTGLQVVLADGRQARFGGRALDYPEYDFVGLLTGSEGTLGLITEASVRLIRSAPAVRTLLVSFDSVEAAGQAVSAIIARGLVPATLEMMDQRIMRIIEDYTCAGLPVESAAALIIEVDGYPASLSPQMEEIVAILRECHCHDLHLAQTAEEREKIWYARKSVGGALTRIAPAYFPVDGTVPRSKIAETLSAITQMCANLNLPVAYLLHAGDGNLHPHIFIQNPADQSLVARVLETGRQIMELCVKQGGSITGEHGVGTEKRIGMPLMYNAEELATMQDIKDLFDPGQLFNPGKIFPPDMPTPAPFSVLSPPPDSPFAPTSTHEAADALRAWLAADPPQRIRIQGSGTKSAGLPSTDVLLSTRSLKGILNYAPEDLYVTVGAGTPLAQLQNDLRKDMLWVPLVSPWQESTLGGIVASNFNAPLRMKYGGVRDLVLAVTAVLPNGRVVRAGRPVVKNVAGYDLTKLFVGSFGTLGLISEITFKIMPLPRDVATLTVPAENLESGIRYASRLSRICLTGSAILLCHACDIPGVAAPYVLFYTAEGLKEDVIVELAQARDVLQAEGASRVTERSFSGSEDWAKWLGKVSSTDTTMRVGVAPKDLPSTLRGLVQILDEAPFIADLGNGQLYVCGMKEVKALQQSVDKVGGYTVVLRMPPDLGNARDVWGYSSNALDLMRRLKARWDPRGMVNPGAFVV
jgi:D-lactate dehydrogenase (cytochrome)